MKKKEKIRQLKSRNETLEEFWDLAETETVAWRKTSIELGSQLAWSLFTIEYNKLENKKKKYEKQK